MFKSKLRRASFILVLSLFTASLAFPRNSGLIQTSTDFLSAQSEPGSVGVPSLISTTVEARLSSSYASADWFVIVGSFTERSNADKRAEYFTARGYDVNVTDTNNFVNWTSNLWAVVMGPYTQKAAKRMMNKVRSFDKNVYIKRGIVGG